MTPSAALDFAIEVMKDRQRALRPDQLAATSPSMRWSARLEDIRAQVAAHEAPAGIRAAFIASTEPPPIGHAAQGGGPASRMSLRRLVTLHDHAGPR